MNGNQTSQNGSLPEPLAQGNILLYLVASAGGMESSSCLEIVSNALASGEI